MKTAGSCFLLSLCVAGTLFLPACVGTAAGPGPSGNEQLTVTIASGGTGTVTSSPSGINCPTTCSANFAQGTQVTLNETPGTNGKFTGWSGACTGTGACTVTMNAAESVTAAFGGGGLQSLNHVIMFLQENRSFDHYFGAMRAYWVANGIPDQSFDGWPQFNPASGAAPLKGPAPSVPGCDPSNPHGATQCTPDTTAGATVSPYHFQSVCQELLSSFWNEAHRDWDLTDPIGVHPAANNGFVVTAADDARQSQPPFNDINGYRAMGFFDWNDLNYYYFMASNFATSDRWFAPVMDRTQINRMYLLAATSAGHVYPLTPTEGQLTNTTIFEELQNAGITWKIYVNPTGTGCSATDSACLAGNSYINMFTYEQTILSTPALLQNIVPISQFTTDAQNGTLPQVALIEPASNAGLDEHPDDSDSFPVNVQAGAAYAAGLINALMTSQSWKDSVIFFSYDESGGFYDHVSPQKAMPPDSSVPSDFQNPNDICNAAGDVPNGTCNFNWTGYRVPLIVISPFTKKNYVSHTVFDYTAMLTFIEKRFNVPPLTKRDAAQADMSEFFDFVNVPWSTPPAPPTQNQNVGCTLGVPVMTDPGP